MAGVRLKQRKNAVLSAKSGPKEQNLALRRNTVFGNVRAISTRGRAATRPHALSRG
jgi:hypothetical protein